MRNSQHNELIRLPINSDLIVFGLIASIVFIGTAAYFFYLDPWHPDHANQFAYISTGMSRNPGWSSLLYGSSNAIVWAITIIVLWGLNMNILILVSTISMISFMGIIGYVQIREPHIFFVVVSIGSFLVVQYFISTSKFGNLGYRITWVLTAVLAAAFISSLYAASSTNYITPYVTVSACIELVLWVFIAFLNAYMTLAVFANKNRLFELTLVQNEDETTHYTNNAPANITRAKTLPYSQLQMPTTLNNNMWDYLSQYSNSIYNPLRNTKVYAPI